MFSPRLLPESALELLQELFPSVQREAIAQAQDEGWRLEDAGCGCWRCGASVGPAAVTARGCPHCLDLRLPWSKLVRLGAYEPPLSRWIPDMKFHGQWAWAPLLGRWLAGRVPAGDGPTVVCPVPMHWRRRCGRGYNQALLLARALAAQHRWPCASLLRRVRLTVPQTQVQPDRRRHNVRGSFAPRDIDLTGWHVWLVDDVKTTGATLTQCARLLRRMNARSVNVAVIAVAEPRHIGFVQASQENSGPGVFHA
jgi:ComF family protein